MKYLSRYNTTKFTDEAIIYGAKVVAFNVLTIVIIILTSLFYSKLIFGLSFIIFFSPMRIINGGAHTKSPILCLFLTTSLFLFSLLILKYLSAINSGYLLISFLFIGIPFLQKNKTLNKSVFLVSGIASFLLTIIFKNRTFFLGYIISFYLFVFLYLFKK